MATLYNMNPTSRMTIGTVGEPGNRTFFLQGGHGSESLSLIIEKTQAIALSGAIAELLGELENRFELPPIRPGRVSANELELAMPIEARFRVAQIGIGYDEDDDQIVIVAQALMEEEEEEPDIARFWISRDQAAALGAHTIEVAAQGRPICPLCGQPIEEDGHFCPRTNGHGNHQ